MNPDPQQHSDESKTDMTRWRNVGGLQHPLWAQRAQAAADFIPSGAIVLDLGCGAQTLRQHLPAGCIYRSCDVVARDAQTQVCDFNKGEFPKVGDATHLTVLGVLEYIHDVPAFLRQLRESGRPIVLSYNPSDFNQQLNRAALGWVNHLTLDQLIVALTKAGLYVATQQRLPDGNQILLRLSCETPPPRKIPRVLVLSCLQYGNFGDRLGYHLIHDVLPPHAEIHHSACDPQNGFKPQRLPTEPLDLVVLGIGNSLFGSSFSEELLRLVERVPKTVGIFGTQYRQAMSLPHFHALLDRLAVWFARYEEDALLFGKGRGNVKHLGDWLVNAFPLTQWAVPKTLTVGDEIWKNLPLDRTIQQIQSYRRVFSTRVHPMLCALTSAEEVAYREQRDGAGVPSGKFRSQLMDVFGRTFPEEQFFAVDHAAVAAYKQRVGANVLCLRETLASMLA